MIRYEILRKFYFQTDHLFHIVKREKNNWLGNPIEITYPDFSTFCKALHGDLTDADLLGYDFDDFDPKKCNLSNAKISSKTMMKLGIYTESTHKMVLEGGELSLVTPSKSLNLTPIRQTYDIGTAFVDYEPDDNIILYISDLHLNHKLIEKFSLSVNDFELDEYFRDIVRNLLASIPKFSSNRSAIFIGDVSFNFNVFRRFFSIYSEMVYVNTFFILGNHELWDKRLNAECKTIEEIVNNYRVILDRVGITLLENELYLPNSKKHVYSSQDIMEMGKDGLRSLFLKNSYGIFGGIGYAGRNMMFNCDNGIYRDAPITRKDEIERSEVLNKLHNTLAEWVPDKKLFFATHMPKSDWGDGSYVPGWVYMSGHTHKNYYLETPERTIYADNQIGYQNGSFGFRFLTCTSHYDLFKERKDGIHKINRDQYLRFYNGLGFRFSFNRFCKDIFMVKKEGTYCFLAITGKKKRLYLLNGGSIKNVGNHDLQYFFDNISNYATSVKLFLKTYCDYQKDVSRAIRKIGGTGTIHGSIVDIDFNDHLYINPLDGKITPYFAYSMTSKYVYRNLISLIKNKCPELYGKYIEIVKSDKAENELMTLNYDLVESDDSVFVDDTEMYRISRILKGLQFTTSYNVVRLWNDAIASNSSLENGRIIVDAIINPKKVATIKAEKKQKVRKLKSLCAVEKMKLSSKEKKEIRFEKYSSQIDKITNGAIEVLSYQGASNKATYKCLLCKNVWASRPDHFKDRQNNQCPKCKSKK